MKVSQFSIRNNYRIVGLLILTSLLGLMLVPKLIVKNYKNLEVSVDEKKIDDLNILQNPRESTVYYEITNGNANRVSVSGDYAYVADGSSGLAIIDISDPTNPGAPIYENTNGHAYDVYVSGDYAYIADWASGLAIIDISDPTNPGAPVYKDTIVRARAIYISGDYAYIAGWGPGEPAPGISEGLAIINISDPTNPGTPIYREMEGLAFGVYVSGDYAYIAVADELPALVIINISDPTNPGTPIYQLVEEGGNGALDVYISGNYAYIANGLSGLAIINIFDPTNPGTPVYEDTTGWARGVYVSGDYAYIGNGESGLAVIDISDPTNPGTPIYENTTGNASGVYIKDDYAYVTEWNSGLAIIHIREMFGPRIINIPSDFIVDFGYTAVSISWTATDQDPNNYKIELQGSGIIFGPTPWLNGTKITYNVPDGLAVGEYNYTVRFTDDYDNFITDTVTMTVKDVVNPIIINSSSNFTVNPDYTGINISWTATDQTPNTYTVVLEGYTTVAGPIAWSNGTPITYNIPEGLAVGEYNYTVKFTDDYDNFITDTVTMTIKEFDLAIPFGNYYLTFLVIGITILLVKQKRRSKSFEQTFFQT